MRRLRIWKNNWWQPDQLTHHNYSVPCQTARCTRRSTFLARSLWCTPSSCADLRSLFGGSVRLSSTMNCFSGCALRLRSACGFTLEWPRKSQKRIRSAVKSTQLMNEIENPKKRPNIVSAHRLRSFETELRLPKSPGRRAMFAQK